MMAQGSSTRAHLWGATTLLRQREILRLQKVNSVPSSPPMTPHTTAGTNTSTSSVTKARISNRICEVSASVPNRPLGAKPCGAKPLEKSEVVNVETCARWTNISAQ
jgi:hypothetical protein